VTLDSVCTNGGAEPGASTVSGSVEAMQTLRRSDDLAGHSAKVPMAKLQQWVSGEVDTVRGVVTGYVHRHIEQVNDGGGCCSLLILLPF
jgi:hypothetical protein